MDNLQLSHLAANCKVTAPHFGGVFAINTLPETPFRLPYSIISNIDPSNKGGSHWICIYFPINGPPEYMDSYGFPPRYEFKRFMNSNYFVYNTQMIQSPYTTVCGQYCLYYLYNRSIKKTMDSVLNSFDLDNLLANDIAVNKFVSYHFKLDLPLYDPEWQLRQASSSFYDFVYS